MVFWFSGRLFVPVCVLVLQGEFLHSPWCHSQLNWHCTMLQTVLQQHKIANVYADITVSDSLPLSFHVSYKLGPNML